jgi:hypothetical protein
LIPVCLSLGILIYFNTDFQLGFKLILFLTASCSIPLICTIFFLSNFKYIQLIFSVVTFILLGYGATVFRVQNITTSNLDHAIQSRIVAEVEEIEIRGNEKKLLLNHVKFLDITDN